MPKAEIKALLLGTPSPSLSHSSSPRTALPSLSAAIGHYKDSLMKVREAQGRKRVLERQLEKKKSTTLNAQKHCDYAEYIQQTADLDRYIKQWNEANRMHKLDQQSFVNRQSKLRIKNNIENSRFFFRASNAHRRQSQKEESELHERSMKDFQEELSGSRIKQRKVSQKQAKKRQEQVAAFHAHKQQQIRNEKHRQIRQLFSHSVTNHDTVNQIVQRNYSLKNRRYREQEAAKRLNADQLPINLACTIKNPQIYAE